VSSEALGFEMMAFVQVHVATISANNNDIILKKIETFPEIVEAYSLTGIWDYILKVVVPSLTRFDEIINIAFGTAGSNLQVQSSFVLKRLKKSTRLPPSGPNAPGP
jgi:DNA-binding Lrp family transcriptional regulator